MTILLQSRASRISDVLTTRDVNEIADAEPGLIQSVVTLASKKGVNSESGSTGFETRPPNTPPASPTPSPTKMSYASVEKDGKVRFER